MAAGTSPGRTVIHSHVRHACIIFAACAGLALGAAPASAADVKIAAKPGLFPAFDPGQRDYVSRCGRTRRLRLSVRPASGGSAALDGGRRRSGRFTERLRLRAGQEAVVASRSGGRTTAYHVRCLPKNVPKWTIERNGTPQAGYYLVTPVRGNSSRFVTMFDRAGVPIWWYEAPTATFDASLLPNGNIAYSRYTVADSFGFRRNQAYEEITLTGQRVRRIRTVGVPTDIHDLQVLPNGNFLILAYKPRDGVDLRSQGGPASATVLDGEIQELTPGGRLVWSWNSKDHVPLDERSPSGPFRETFKLADGREAYDIFHINSVERHGAGELLISARATSSLYNIDRSTGNVLWKLGGTETPQSLETVGDDRPRPTFGGQHDARVLKDGTVTLFDNATGRSLPPRALRYRIDTAAGTATLLENIADPDVPISNYAGGARRLSGGNWVVAWGGKPIVGEYAPTGEQVFNLQFDENFFSYRAIPITPQQLSHSALRRAMNAQYPRR
jgi:outer membrane protein assembly factor BamB